jgi:hypothetical protein
MSNIAAAEITNADAIHPGIYLKIQNFSKNMSGTRN